MVSWGVPQADSQGSNPERPSISESQFPFCKVKRVILTQPIVKNIWDKESVSILRMGRATPSCGCRLVVHQYILNGCYAPGIGLGPGTPWWANRAPACTKLAVWRADGQWVSAHSLTGFPVVLCEASSPYHLAHYPIFTPGLQ